MSPLPRALYQHCVNHLKQAYNLARKLIGSGELSNTDWTSLNAWTFSIACLLIIAARQLLTSKIKSQLQDLGTSGLAIFLVGVLSIIVLGLPFGMTKQLHAFLTFMNFIELCAGAVYISWKGFVFISHSFHHSFLAPS
jgi:hypothetical protein